MFDSRNPAGRAAGELGLLTAVLASGAMSCHERGMAAVAAGREQRASDAWADAHAMACRDRGELAEVARAALEEVARLQDEVADLREACAQRQAYIERVRPQLRAARAAS